MPKGVRHVSIYRGCSVVSSFLFFLLIMHKFISFTSLSARSLPEIPDYVHSPPPQQEVNTRTARTEELVFSHAEMP